MYIKPRLMDILREKGMTQIELSDITGIPQGSISRFDKNEFFKAHHLFVLSRALGVNIEDLFRITIGGKIK